MGMTGNQDRAAGPGAWAADLQDAFMPMIDESVAVLRAVALAPGDMGAAVARARAVGVMARSVRAVVGMVPTTRRADRQVEEDEMKHRDDSPENLERMRADLEARLDRLNSVLESKGIVVEPGCWPTARPERERLHPA